MKVYPILLALFLLVFTSLGYGQYIVTQYQVYSMSQQTTEPIEFEDINNDSYLDVTIGRNSTYFPDLNNLHVN
ncbi:hypothetical protein B1H10_07310 [candidate division KSB1 bacterium 4484_188]|nr:MAG: hypothetical protein B1H10_07310 [candidate division KSB1 bacterium 4484_188]